METARKLWWWVVKFMIELGGAVKPVAAKVWRWLIKESVVLGIVLTVLVLHELLSFMKSLSGGEMVPAAISVVFVCCVGWAYWTKWRHQVNIPLPTRDLTVKSPTWTEALQDWQKRVIDESDDLFDRLVKLESFLDTLHPTGGLKIDEAAERLLRRQVKAMTGYLEILCERIKAFGGQVNEGGKP